jgi:hypothetical protein
MKNIIKSILNALGLAPNTDRAVSFVTSAVKELDAVLEIQLASHRDHIDAEQRHKELGGVALREAQRAARISKKLEDLVGGDA